MRQPNIQEFCDYDECDYEAFSEAMSDYEDDQYEQYIEREIVEPTHRGKMNELQDYLNNKASLDQIAYHLPMRMMDKSEPEIRAFIRDIL